MFAHDNAVENLVVFVPLVLILAELDYSTKWTAYACAVYFWARVAHLIVYTMGLPVFRTLASGRLRCPSRARARDLQMA